MLPAKRRAEDTSPRGSIHSDSDCEPTSKRVKQVDNELTPQKERSEEPLRMQDEGSFSANPLTPQRLFPE